MSDRWHTFPATMGEDQAWLTVDVGYADEAKTDPRSHVIRVQVAFRDPTEAGLPTSAEYPGLKQLDERLDSALEQLGAAYVGRVTVAAHRYFYFYTEAAQEEVARAIEQVQASSGYRLSFLFEADEEKRRYWEELYPTADDWQVIRDLQVLDALDDEGDVHERERRVHHWAYFNTDVDAGSFREWAEANGYSDIEVSIQNDTPRFRITYAHVGTMRLGDITRHTIRSGRAAREFNGDYDGWETPVEKE